MLLNGYDRNNQESEQNSFHSISLSPKKPTLSIINQSNKAVCHAQNSLLSTLLSTQSTPVKAISKLSQDQQVTPKNGCEEAESGDEITVEVMMKSNTEAIDGSKTTPTNQGLIMENINLKLQNQDLQLELANSKKRLLVLNNQVHNLSQLVDGVQCICETCNIH